MGITSQTGQVGLKIQDTPGTYADPGDGGIFLRLKSGSLSGKRDAIMTDPEIGGNRDVSQAYLGPIVFSGEYEFYARLESLPTLLYGALGSKSSASTGTGPTLVGTHTIKQSEAALPRFSIEEKIGNTYEVFQYTDGVINTLHLEVDGGGSFVSGTVGIIALGQTAGATPTASPVWDISPLLVSTNLVCTYNSVDLKGKKLSIDINNNFEDNDFRLGSIFAADLTPKRREVTLGLTVRPTDSALWRQATYGSSAATVATGGPAAAKALNITAQSYENIGSSSTKYSLTIDAPSVFIKPFEVKPSGDDIIEHDLELQMLRPDPSVDLMTAVVKNHYADVF